MKKNFIPKIKIASFFAEKFEIPLQRAAKVLDDVAGIAILESKIAKSFTFPGISKMILSKTRTHKNGNSPTLKKPQ